MSQSKIDDTFESDCLRLEEGWSMAADELRGQYALIETMSQHTRNGFLSEAKLNRSLRQMSPGEKKLIFLLAHMALGEVLRRLAIED